MMPLDASGRSKVTIARGILCLVSGSFVFHTASAIAFVPAGTFIRTEYQSSLLEAPITDGIQDPKGAVYLETRPNYNPKVEGNADFGKVGALAAANRPPYLNILGTDTVDVVTAEITSGYTDWAVVPGDPISGKLINMRVTTFLDGYSDLSRISKEAYGEPPRLSRRPFCLSHAGTADSLAAR
jgi:hypothetical protein